MKTRPAFATHLFIVLSAGFLLQWTCARAAGTWSPVNPAPGSLGTMLLLSDGTVMAQNSGSAIWYRLAPDNHGSYVNGTWTTLAQAHDGRLYYASQVLTNGNVYVAGGEYGSGHDLAELYDPVRDVWTQLPTPSGYALSDDISVLLPTGNVMQWGEANGALIFDLSSNYWRPTGATIAGQGESSWVKLSDDSILTVDSQAKTTERYFPALDQWVSQGSEPVPLHASGEIGPAFVLPNGNAIFFGATTNTAIFTPNGSTGTWVAGSGMPNAMGMSDSTGCMMVNGKILCLMGTNSTLDAPTFFYEYDYLTDSFQEINGPTGLTFPGNPYEKRLLSLPDGSVLMNQNGIQPYIYFPDGTPLAMGKPAILSITTNANGSFHLTGQGLNGLSAGAAYGDDAQMDANRPLVRMTNLASGLVYYARTFNWTSTSVLTNKTSSTEFSLPAGLPFGTYSLSVVANGFSSDPVTFTTPFALCISPALGFSFSGATWGPFSPSSETFTLTNAGAASLNWSLVNTSAWLNATPVAGTLAAGATSAVTVSLNAIASNTVAGVYQSTFWFSNLTTGDAISRQFSFTPINGDSPIAFTGFNRDVVIEQSATTNLPPDSFAQPFDVEANYAFYEENIGASTNASLGLPNGGFFTSCLDTLSTFQLGPYTGNNVLFMESGGSGTLTLASPAAYGSLSILAGSAEGGSSGVVQIHFTDGTSSTQTYAAPDWHNNLGGGLTHVGQMNLDSYSADDPGGNNPTLYHTKLDLLALGLAQKQISSLTFFAPSGTGISSNTDTGIFALSGTAARPPVILIQPQSLTVLAGTTASFSLVATGAVTLNYRWSVNGAALSDNSLVTGSRSNLLSIGSITTNDAGNYTAVVTNFFGSVTSIVATLNVVPPPKLEPIALTNGSLTLAWVAATGFSYQLQFSTNLTQAAWVNLGPPAAASNSFMTATEPIAGIPNGFYRLLILP